MNWCSAKSTGNVTYLQVDEPALRSTLRPSLQMVPGRAPVQAHCKNHSENQHPREVIGRNSWKKN
jgi:hypothetical protein